MGNPAPVAQPFSLDETNTEKSDYSLSSCEKDKKNTYGETTKENLTLLSFDKKDIENQRAWEMELVLRFENIATNTSALAAYKIILQKGCSFAKEIETLCKVSTATSYRSIEALLSQSLIFPLTKITLKRTPGDKPVIFGLSEHLPDEAKQAARRYIASRKKTYKYIQEVYQSTLDDVRDQEIQFNKILWKSNRYGKGMDRVTLAEEVALMHQENNIKVWR